MKGIDMTAKGLIAPLHKIVDRVNLRNSQEENSGKGHVYFIAIGDGGNEMGMVSINLSSSTKFLGTYLRLLLDREKYI